MSWWKNGTSVEEHLEMTGTRNANNKIPQKKRRTTPIMAMPKYRPKSKRKPLDWHPVLPSLLVRINRVVVEAVVEAVVEEEERRIKNGARDEMILLQ
jgi:hypothetical protein